MRRRLTTREFIERSVQKHGNRYDYSESNYIKDGIKIKILCSTHGYFYQNPNDHMCGSGCISCGGRKKRTTQEFINESIDIHGNLYDYSLAKYINQESYINIICKTHGIFQQSSRCHITLKHGCPMCGAESSVAKRRFTISEFIQKAKIIHNSKYNYLKSEYRNANSEIIIICPKHGEFEQTPWHHLIGSGCPKCSCNKSKPEIEWLDSLGILEQYRQHRLVINETNIKADAYDPITNTVYEFWGDFWHGNPKIFSANSINKKNNKTFGELYHKTQEKRKLILDAGYKLIEIWERDWTEINNKITM